MNTAASIKIRWLTGNDLNEAMWLIELAHWNQTAHDRRGCFSVNVLSSQKALSKYIFIHMFV
jgi:hypothetical protein